MNLKQFAILGLGLTTLATSVDAKPRRSTPKTPPIVKKTTPTQTTTQAQCDYAVSQVFEPLYETLKKTEGTFLYAYMDSKGVPTCCTGIAITNPMWKNVVFRSTKTKQPLTKQQKENYLAEVRKTKTYAKAKAVALKHGVYIDPSEAKKLSYKTVKLAYGEMYKWAKEKHGIDLLKEPIEIQLLVADLSYQLGYPKFQKRWPKFWKAVKEKDYAAVVTNCQTNEGNVIRENIREALAKSALAKQQGKDYSAQLAVLTKYGIGHINHYLTDDPQGKSLMAKALKAKSDQKKATPQNPNMMRRPSSSR